MNKQMATNRSAWIYSDEFKGFSFILASFNGKSVQVNNFDPPDFDYKIYLEKEELKKLKDFLNEIDL